MVSAWSHSIQYGSISLTERMSWEWSVQQEESGGMASYRPHGLVLIYQNQSWKVEKITLKWVIMKGWNTKYSDSQTCTLIRTNKELKDTTKAQNQTASVATSIDIGQTQFQKTAETLVPWIRCQTATDTSVSKQHLKWTENYASYCNCRFAMHFPREIQNGKSFCVLKFGWNIFSI
jgi:hypothetical protein